MGAGSRWPWGAVSGSGSETLNLKGMGEEFLSLGKPQQI